MASTFAIFEDQENVMEKKVVQQAHHIRDPSKLAPLTSKAISNENAREKQVS